jgi:hypothetical protein
MLYNAELGMYLVMNRSPVGVQQNPAMSEMSTLETIEDLIIPSPIVGNSPASLSAPNKEPSGAD